jgi:serine/threonine protein kinase
MNLLQVKIGDFGLATTNIKLTDLTLNLDRSLTDENQSDMTGQIGTAMYVAPEINAGKNTAD